MTYKPGWLTTGGGGDTPKASTTVTGTVKTDANEVDPLVYTKASVDTALGTKAASSHTHAIADTTGLMRLKNANGR